MKLEVHTRNGSATEQVAKDRFESLIAKFDVEPYVFTNKVFIEDKAIPHSHPDLTLNSFPYDDENIILDAFIHEQLHWYLESKSGAVNDAAAEFKVKYPDAPWGFPLGCLDQQSTYDHLILCYLANDIMKRLVDEQAAGKVLYYLQNHHYLWVYRTIAEDVDLIASIIDKYELTI